MKPPSFNAYPNNWLGSGRVSAMLPEQEGAYFRLLCYQWNSENQTIPDSDEDLAMLSRLNGRWATLGAKVRACFDRVDGGGLRNERLWHEYTRIMGLRERQSAGGKKAMGNRWNQPQDSTKQPISDLQDTYNREQRTENRESGVGNRETEGKEEALRESKSRSFALPEWLTSLPGWKPALWDAWLDTRRKKRASNTPHALSLLVDKLAQRKPEAIEAINMSVEAGWQGFEWAWFDGRKTGNRTGGPYARPGADPDEHRRAKAAREYPEPDLAPPMLKLSSGGTVETR
jgi:uncharacterized protein YdaU (DUF1376 family)